MADGEQLADMLAIKHIKFTVACASIQQVVYLFVMHRGEEIHPQHFFHYLIIAANVEGSYRNPAEICQRFVDRVAVQADLLQFIRVEVRLIIIR